MCIRDRYQATNLLPDLTGAENIFLNEMQKRGGLIHYKKMYADARAQFEKMGYALDAARKVRDPVSYTHLEEDESAEPEGCGCAPQGE